MTPSSDSAVGLGQFGGPFDGVVAVFNVGGLVLVSPHPEVFAIGGVTSPHVLDNDRVTTFGYIGCVLLVARGEFVVRGSAD